MRIARINNRGLEQIAEALGQHHRLGRDHFTSPMLNAWAAEAERSFDNGGACTFEIRGFDSVTGRPVEVTIAPDGYDLVDVDED